MNEPKKENPLMPTRDMRRREMSIFFVEPRKYRQPNHSQEGDSACSRLGHREYPGEYPPDDSCTQKHCQQYASILEKFTDHDVVTFH